MKEPSPMPDAVIDAIFKFAGVRETHICPICLEDHGGSGPVESAKAQRILCGIKWYGIMGCYGFEIGSMFVGVELDGYMHT